jgi:ornithine carbamoyltransferase
MKHLIDFSNLNKQAMAEIFALADVMPGTTHNHAPLKGKTFVLFFPFTSVRSRVSFEKGISLLGGNTILFPPDSLDKNEDMQDVIGYLNNWADCIVVRHSSIDCLKSMAESSNVPIINAMTTANHPCEILSDLYALSKIHDDYLSLQYTYFGPKSNIGNTWFEASKAFGLSFRQCCPSHLGYEIDGADVIYDPASAMIGSDILLTDSWDSSQQKDFAPYQVTLDLMKQANAGALLNPCPPFYRGEEVSFEVIESNFFVGYGFKKVLLEVQRAIILYCMEK